MNRADSASDRRFNELRQWLESLGGFELSSLEPASADASFRRYFRVRSGANTYVVMDAPPDKEDCGPFIRVAAFLQQMGLNGPRVIEANTDQGFLLLSDLGSTQYLAELRQNEHFDPVMYTDAIDALIVMQSKGAPFLAKLPPYDERLLRFELSLFSDWLCERHLGIRLAGDELQHWQQLCELLVSSALEQPRVFVHRDYHSRNLMRVQDNNPGILDFQDAVAGPLTYDLVSLLRDCYFSPPPHLVKVWVDAFHRNAPAAKELSPDVFPRYFDLMGVQRQLKAAGIFCRLNHRDGKLAYMQDIPRTLNYILEIAPRYEELEFLAGLIRRRILPGLEADAA
jgi:aminoglycoside/choline kinase family phosphotransferase